MDALTAVLGGLGLFGIIGAVLVGGLMLVLIPFWSILDCAVSRRDNGTKVLLIVLLFVTWTLGALVYAVFVTESRTLRRFTVISTLVAVMVAIVSVSLLIGGAAIHSTRESERRAEEEAIVQREFRPGAMDAAAVAPFKAVYVVGDGSLRRSAAVADFKLDGPVVSSALNIDERVRHIIHEPQSGRYYGITQHEFGVVHPESRQFEEIAVDPSLERDFSWPKGLALDPATGEVIVLTSHVDTDFFIFAPAAKRWKNVATGIRGRSFVAMTYDPGTQMFYLMEETRGAAVRELHRFNRSGASIGPLALNPPIPASRQRDANPQMAVSSGTIILLLPRERANPSILAVEPESGVVLVAGPKP